MQITSVQMKLLDKPNSKANAVATIVIENAFVIHQIYIYDKGNDIAFRMPSKKGPDGKYYDYVHPINATIRAVVYNELADKYKELVANKSANATTVEEKVDTVEEKTSVETVTEDTTTEPTT